VHPGRQPANRRPDYDGLLDLFPVKFHEPYYGSYLREDLPELFGAAGFEAISTELAFMSKIITFYRQNDQITTFPRLGKRPSENAQCMGVDR
jgi:hypothetical protein